MAAETVEQVTIQPPIDDTVYVGSKTTCGQVAAVTEDMRHDGREELADNPSLETCRRCGACVLRQEASGGVRSSQVVNPDDCEVAQSSFETSTLTYAANW